MNFEVLTTPGFRKLFRKLSKKYPSIKSELSELIIELRSNPNKGISLGQSVFKIRMAISSKGKGKSGGARVITYLLTEEYEVYLAHIYDKGQLDNLSKEHIISILELAGLIDAKS